VIAGIGPEKLKMLPENVIAVPYAPQLELLQKASLTLSHGGLNTVLDSLACGVPLLVIPIPYEQPAIAERVRWTGAGETLPFSAVHAAQIRAEIQKVLGTAAYADRAKRICGCIRAAGGVNRAADHIEKIIQ
jgi:MGT family glycosyltransferase